jgi:magnesium and cobalt transporter
MADDKGPTGLGWLDRNLRLFMPGNPPQTRSQIKEWLQQAQQRDIIPFDTLGMMEGALDVADMHVRDVMVPRAQMITLPYNSALESLLELITDSGHSRFPVIGDNRDDVMGILLAKDLLHFCIGKRKDALNLRELLRPAIFIPESKRLNVLLREFRTSRNHMAIVVDEYGGVAGLVTIEDVIEEIVGEIDDEHDLDNEIYIKPRECGRHTVRALTPVEVFNSYFKTDFSDAEFDTIGGLIMKALGHLPKRRETLILGGFHFEVLRSDSRRIHLLRVQRVQDPSPRNNDNKEEENTA